MVTSIVARRPWRLVAPWYREHQQPEAHADTRPIFQKYEDSDFVTQFLADPQHSLKFIDDDLVAVRTALPAVPVLTTFPNLRRRLSAYTMEPGDTRKLFLDIHKRFYLLVWEVRAEAYEFPCVGRDRICEAGFVVRRRRLDVPPEAIPEMRKVVAQYQEKKAAVAVLEKEKAAAGGGGMGLVKGATIDHVLEQAAVELTVATEELQAEAEALGVRHVHEGWIVDPVVAGIGSWQEVPTQPAEIAEVVYPAHALVPDPAVADHSGQGASLYFGAVPTASGLATAAGVPQFDETSVYEARAFVRRHDPACPRKLARNDCHGDLFWSKATEQYQLAAQFDLIGTSHRPVNIQLPDFNALEAQAAALPPGAATPIRMSAPSDSTLMFDVDSDGNFTAQDPATSGTQEICFFAWPLITIVAMFLLKLFLPIVTFVFGLWFMLKLKLCIPPSLEIGAEFNAALDVVPPSISFEAEFDLAVDLGTIGDFIDAMDNFEAGFDDQLGPNVGAALTNTGPVQPGYSAKVLAELTTDLGNPIDRSDPDALFTAGVEYEERWP